MLNRSHIMPEYSFLDARELGAFEGKSLDALLEILIFVQKAFVFFKDQHMVCTRRGCGRGQKVPWPASTDLKYLILQKEDTGLTRWDETGPAPIEDHMSAVHQNDLEPL